MGPIKGAGEKPVLPEMSATSALGVSINSIAAMGFVESSRERFRLLRRYNPVHVICHETVPDQVRPRAQRADADKPEIYFIVGIRKKHVLPIQPSMSKMVRHAHQYRSCHSRHLWI